MAESENIGTISVAIVGDYSKLQADIDTAAGIAAEGGQEIAEALGKGAEGADAITGALRTATSTAGTFEEQIEALVNSGSTLAEAMATVQASTEGIATGMQQAAAGVELLNDAEESAVSAASTLADSLSAVQASTEDIASVAGQAASGMDSLATAEEHCGAIAEDAAGAEVALTQATEQVGESAQQTASLFQELANVEESAVRVGQEVTQVFESEIAGAEALSGAIASTASGIGSFEQQIQALVDSGSTLAEALATVQAASEGIAIGVSAAGNAAADAATQMNLFDDSVQVSYADATGQLNLFATELESIPGAAASAAEAAKELADSQEAVSAASSGLATAAGAAAAAADELADAEEHAGESAHHAESGIAGMAEKLIAFGEGLAIIEGLKELGTEALHAADDITRASISLTVLTGDAEKAKEIIEEIEALGIKDGLALPGLLSAATRMTALLGASAPVPELLGKIADGAAVMGTSIEAAANSFDKLVTSGTLGIKQLMPLGLTLEKVAAAMNEVVAGSGATAENIKKLFKDMSSGADDAEKTALRIEILSKALDGLKGTAQEAAEKTFGGQWQILGNQWEQIMAGVGQAIDPVIKGFTDLIKVDILPFIKETVDGFNGLPAPIRLVAVDIGLLGSALVPTVLSLGGLGQAIVGIQQSFVLVAPALQSAAAGIKTFVLAEQGAITASASLTIGLGAIAAGLAAVALNAGGVATKMGEWLDKKGINLADWIVGLASGQNIGAIAAKSYADSMAHLNKVAEEAKAKLTGATKATEEHAKAAEYAGNSLGAFSIKMQSLRDAVTSSKQNLDELTAKYNETGRGAAEVAKAYDTWKSAVNALKTAQEAANPSIKEAREELKKQEDAVKSFAKTADEFANKIPQTYAAYTASLTEGGKAASAMVGQLEEQINKATTAMAGMSGKPLAAMQAVVAQLKQLHETAKAFAAEDAWNKMAQQIAGVADKYADQMGKLEASTLDWVNAAKAAARDIPDALNKAGDAEFLEKWGAAMEKLAREGEKLDAQFQKMAATSEKALSPYKNGILETIPITISLRDRIGETAAALLDFEATAKRAGVATVSAMESQIATNKELLTSLQAMNQPLGTRLDLTSKILQEEIHLAEQSGTSATSQIVALENIKIQQQSLYDSTHALGDLYVGVVDSIVQAYDRLGDAIADAIIEGKNFGEVMLNVGKEVAKQILAEIIGYALKQLKTAFLGLIDNVGALGKAIEKTFGLNIPSLKNDQKGGVSFGDAGGLVGGATSLTSSVGMISSLINTISGIVGNFQFAAMNKSLDRIVEHTLRIYNEINNTRSDHWSRFSQEFERQGEIWRDMKAGFVNVVAAIGAISIGTGGEGKPKTPAEDPWEKSQREWRELKEAELRAQYEAAMAAKKLADAQAAAAEQAAKTAQAQTVAAQQSAAAANSTSEAAYNAGAAATSASSATDSVAASADSVATATDSVAVSAELLSGAIENTGADTAAALDTGFADTSKSLRDLLNGLGQAASDIIANLTAGFGRVAGAIAGVPQFAEGGYVPHNMLAFIHGGEAVIPRTAVNSLQNTLGSTIRTPLMSGGAPGPEFSDAYKEQWAKGNALLPDWAKSEGYGMLPHFGRSSDTAMNALLQRANAGSWISPGQMPSETASNSFTYDYSNARTDASTSIGAIHFNIVNPNPRDAARQIAEELKTVSPAFAASSR